MTDDSNARYRSRDHYDRGLEPAGSNSDPLAELARLIGQNDPFAQLRLDAQLAAERNARRPDDHAPSDWDTHADAQHAPATSYDTHEPAAAPSYAAAAEPQSDPHGYAAEPHGLSPRSDAHRYHVDPEPQPADYRAPAFHHDESLPRHEAPTTAAPDDYANPPAPYADEFDDDARARGRSRGLITVLAVLGLAAVGSGAAFAYRTYFSAVSKSEPPPIIRASAEPTKVAPPPAKNDTATNKINYDRFGDRSQNEQVVVREEKPIDPKNLVTAPAAAPIPAFPPPPAASQPAAAPFAAAAPQASATPPSVLTEPKRVRTVAVRPDQPGPATQPQMAAPPPTRGPTATIASPIANAPLNVTLQPAARTQTAVAPTPAPVRSAPARNTPAPSANAPLSLAPNGTTLPPPTRSVRAAAPTPLASAPPPASRTGSYLVQVSSQKSEADAQSSFRSIRSKYSGVLGSREPVIRRADLGAKGVYYRAMVGPFSTRDEAIQLCASLKTAGGACVVQGN